MDTLLQDVRYAIRSLRRSPLFVLTVLVIVSLGTGVASAMFGVVHHLLVRPFDVEVPSPWRYYLVYPPGLAQSPKLAIFRQWLRDEIVLDAQTPPPTLRARSPGKPRRIGKR